ncbi:hypothetical protein [Streptomyces sp. NBC_01727]|uniref:hypothetical protein n=1 Tax=Streptomyces sp. NBC_01727 TaxID=2975924 RepID=UPI002E11C6D3|nr:hypothetical protein OIE76_40340 [Streptomyces sp. NBC_01727]
MPDHRGSRHASLHGCSPIGFDVVIIHRPPKHSGVAVATYRKGWMVGIAGTL